MTAPTGRLIHLPDGEQAWQIDGLEGLAPFLVSVVSAGDHWLYVSTSGGLTAGRVDAARALFPYETDDRLHAAAGLTGPVTLIRARGTLWSPFDPRGLAPGRRRTLRKAALGHWIELEEQAPELGLTFRYRWTTSERFGLARRVTLEGDGVVEVLDGLVNLMPADVPAGAQQAMSALVDAYKRSERVGDTLGLYALEALLSDSAAPAEALRANVVWRLGLPGAQVALSEGAIRDFREGRPTPPADLAVGVRGAYLTRATVDLARGPARWDLLCDVHLDHVALTALARRLASPDGLAEALEADLAAGARALRQNVAAADGLQLSADSLVTVHHVANVVFNNLRGGVFADDHRVPVADFVAFVAHRNARVAARHAAWLADLPYRVPHGELRARAEAADDPQLARLVLEYLPLTFSRRHGDPSRPWNAFHIRIKHPDGRPIYAYAGNWRDIFQNWEALAQSFPAFLEPMIAKFVNASTRDGFNPYRLTHEGVDWERPDPHDPWGNLGYWGDHQIVYLFRLLEAAEAHRPGAIRAWLGRDLFSYAAVPYRLRPYADLCRDAKDTIVYDAAAEARVRAHEAALGADGRLVLDAAGEVLQVNLLEKLLVSVLAKVSNLVVDGGIWMNTQRPEWNDANNALVGHGLSVVTLAQLRRALGWLAAQTRDAGAWPVSRDVGVWFAAVFAALTSERPAPGPVDPATRRRLLDRLGGAFSDYRAAVYAGGDGARDPLSGAQVAACCDAALAWVDHSLAANRRPDGLYHSYNLLTLAPDTAVVSPLYEMLEGQVAVLGSGLLSPREAIATVDALYASALYRPDQASFLLYPARKTPRFLDRNRLDPAAVTPLLQALLDADDRRIVARDVAGDLRFDAACANADKLAAALDALAREPRWAAAVAEGRAAVLEAYEGVFHHHAFTGRSGTMYKYEGLGSIYWHMVSKLLLAVQEAFWAAVDGGADPADVAALAERYYRVRAGLSFNKSVAEYGAVPTDPYSHTPAHLGAQQPGMTGQVKEEILTRFGELGVRVRGGAVTFEPRLLRRSELLPAPARWAFVGPGGVEQTIEVPAGSVAFTLAQTPVVLTAGAPAAIEVGFADGGVRRFEGGAVDAAVSAAWLGRGGEVVWVRVIVAEDGLLGATPQRAGAR